MGGREGRRDESMKRKRRERKRGREGSKNKTQ